MSADYKTVFLKAAMALLLMSAFACFGAVVERYGEYREERGKAKIVTADPYYPPKSLGIEGQVKDHEDWVLCLMVDMDGLDIVKMETESMLQRVDKERVQARYTGEMDHEYAAKWIESFKNRVTTVGATYRSRAIASFGLDAVMYQDSHPRTYRGDNGPSFQPVMDQLWLSFQWSWLPMAMFLLLTMFRRKMTWQQMIWELFTPWRYPWAVCLWPVFAWSYHKYQPVQIVIHGFQVVGGAAVTLLLWFGGGQAYGQTAGAKSFGKRAEVAVIEDDRRLLQPTVVADGTDLDPAFLCQPDDLLLELQAIPITEVEKPLPTGSAAVTEEAALQKPMSNGWLKWRFSLLHLQAMANVGDDAKSFTPELSFSVKMKQLIATTFAFCDARLNAAAAQRYFCNVQNSVGLTSLPQISLGVEWGHSSRGYFASLAAKLNLMAIPQVKSAITKGVRSLTATLLFRLTGPVTEHQLLIIGRSQNLSLVGSLYVYFQGAVRFRAGPYKPYSWLEWRVGSTKWLKNIVFGGHYEPVENRFGIGPRLIFK